MIKKHHKTIGTSLLIMALAGGHKTNMDYSAESKAIEARMMEEYGRTTLDDICQFTEDKGMKIDLSVPKHLEKDIQKNIDDYVNRKDFRDFLEITENIDILYNNESNRTEFSQESRESLKYLTMAISFVETNGNPHAVSKSNAKTVMGIMPYNLKKNGVDKKLANTYAAGIKGGTNHLVDRLKETDGSAYFSIVGYNGGENGVLNRLEEFGMDKRTTANSESQLIRFHNSWRNKETRDYAAKVFAAYEIISNPQLYGLERTANPTTIHKVKPGETVYRIAKNYGVKPDNIVKNNGLKNNSVIYPNQSLVIPMQ